jgi:hypothetical protein
VTSNARTDQAPAHGDLDPETFRELPKSVVDLMANSFGCRDE